MYKVITTSLFVLLPLSQSLAVTENDLRLCSTISNDSQRLQCFDNLVSQLPVYSPGSQAKTLATVPATATEPVKAVVAATPMEPAKTVPVTQTAQAVVAQSTPEVSTAVQPQSSVQVQEQNPASVKENFGLEHKKTVQEEQVQAVELTIAKAKKSIHGNWTLTFENGQQWRTLSSERTKFKTGQQVEIKRGVLNSFSVSIVGSNRAMKVKRLK